MFVKIPTMRKYMTIPSNIFDDNRLSIGAKGLYVQLIYSNDNINSLHEIEEYSSSNKAELDKLFNELAEFGYVVVKNKSCNIIAKPQMKETIDKKINREEVKEYTEITKDKPKSAYEKMVSIIRSYDLPKNVKNLLIVYFTNWLNKKGRYEEADTLHSTKVRMLIGDLISFHLGEDDMITCVQSAIDHEYFKFIIPNKKFNQFDKSTITSGSYTAEDIKKIKEKAAMMNAEGKKGLF